MIAGPSAVAVAISHSPSLLLPLHGGGPAGAPPHSVVLALAVVALGLLSWGGTVALDAAVDRLL